MNSVATLGKADRAGLFRATAERIMVSQGVLCRFDLRYVKINSDAKKVIL